MTSALLPLLLLLPPQAPTPAGASAQDPKAPELLARYRFGEQIRAVAADEVALEMAFHQRRKDDGRAACEHLVDAALVRAEAEPKRLMPTEAEAREFWRRLLAQLQAAGRKPEEFAALRNTPEHVFLQDIAVQIAHERLVRQELAMRADEEVSPGMLKLWLQEARKRHAVVTDPDVLPVGAAALLDGRELPMLQLGRLLLRTAGDDERERFTRQVILLQLLDRLAQQHGVTVGQDDLRAELEARRLQAETDPRFGGLSYEQLLKSQGLTPELVLRSNVFRGQVLQKKLVAKLHPRDALLAEIAQDRQAVLDRAGPRRHLALIFARALQEPNQLVPRDFAAAREHLARVREQLVEGRDFELTAKIESDDPASKMRGGDVGWHFRRSRELPEPVLAAAFALESGGLSQPIEADAGCYLVKVLATEPAPTDDELIQRLREQLVDQLTQQVLTEARIEILD